MVFKKLFRTIQEGVKMISYLGVAVFLAIGSVVEQRSKDKRMRENFFRFSLLLLILFFGLRGYIGYDWYSYEINFRALPSIREILNPEYHKIFFSSYELGFQIYTSIIKFFTENYFIYNFINNIIDFILLYIILKRYSKYYLLSLALYFAIYGLAFEIDMLRNIKSILCFLLSIKYLEERNLIKYSLLNLLGVCFHISSIIYFPMYFILKINWNRKLILALFVLGNIYYFLDMRIVLKLITEHGEIFPMGIGKRLAGYFSIIPLDFPLGFTPYYLERLLIFLLCWFVDERIKVRSYGNIMLNSIYIWVFFFLYFSEFSIVSFRFSLLFAYSYWFVLPILLDIYPKIYIIILMILVSLFRLENQLNFVGNRIVYPYQNILLKHSSLEEQREKVEKAGEYKSLGHGKEISLLF